MTLALRIRAYRVAKAGRSIAECEDAAGYDEVAKCFAVADGASASARAADWATRLVVCFMDAAEGARMDMGSWWSDAAAGFGAGVDGADGGWWAEEVARRGAYATFLGVQVIEADLEMKWECVAVGDSCIFLVRDGRLATAFPVDDARNFGSTPDLVGTNRPPAAVHHAGGHLEPGDVLLGLSDALAAWALERAVNDDDTWRFVSGLRSDTFASFVNAARASGELEDDDVSLVRCEVLS